MAVAESDGTEREAQRGAVSEEQMKRIEAIIKPCKLEEVEKALAATQVHGMTVSEGKRFGRQRGQVEQYRGAEYEVQLITKARVDLVVGDDQAGACVPAIEQAAKTGRIGDGKIFMLPPIDESVRIRTGERGSAAL